MNEESSLEHFFSKPREILRQAQDDARGTIPTCHAASKEMFEIMPKSRALGGIHFRRGRPYMVPYGNHTVGQSALRNKYVDAQSNFARTFLFEGHPVGVGE